MTSKQLKKSVVRVLRQNRRAKRAPRSLYQYGCMTGIHPVQFTMVLNGNKTSARIWALLVKLTLGLPPNGPALVNDNGASRTEPITRLTGSGRDE